MSDLTRREILRLLSGSALLLPAMSLACRASLDVPVRAASKPYTGSDEQLLDEIEQAAFRFFWEQANPKTGLIKDRALVNGNDQRGAGSIAATGFGLTALCIGVHRGSPLEKEVKERVRTTLRFIRQRLQGKNGWFFHFVDIDNGERIFRSELSSIDTAILLCGVLTCREFYKEDAEIQGLATDIYHAVDFPWMLDGGTTLSMGWKPEKGFLSARWNHYSELMMIYLLGIGSPTHPLPPETWEAWSRPVVEFEGFKYISGAPTLFTHQFSHAWFDFRGRRDQYADYFANSVTATEAHKVFCLSLSKRFKDYSEDLWGISASDSVHGYEGGWGGPPKSGPIDGTIVPCAAGGSVAFLPQEAIRVLRNIRSRYGDAAWGRYGFVDAFNPLTDWYDADVIGIDQGITILMAENYRSQFVWKTFMANPEVKAAMDKVLPVFTR